MDLRRGGSGEMGLASVREGGRGCGGDERAGEGDAVASKDDEDAWVGVGYEGEEPERIGGAFLGLG